METVFIIIGIAILGGYIALVILANDFVLPELDFFKYKQAGKPLTILALYPHPDDETMSVGGTFARLASMPDTRLVVLTATHGEAGETNGVCTAGELAAVRAVELKNALLELGVREFILLDLPDGGLDQHPDQLESLLTKHITQIEPDILITYDNSGLYGHPDHIVLSEIVQQLQKNKFPQVKLLFNTMPTKLLKKIKLPEKITLYGQDILIDKHKLQHTLPRYKFSYWRYVGKKVRAIKAHKSQNIAKHLPLPVDLYGAVTAIEYFSEP